MMRWWWVVSCGSAQTLLTDLFSFAKMQSLWRQVRNTQTVCVPYFFFPPSVPFGYDYYDQLLYIHSHTHTRTMSVSFSHSLSHSMWMCYAIHMENLLLLYSRRQASTKILRAMSIWYRDIKCYGLYVYFQFGVYIIRVYSIFFAHASTLHNFTSRISHT